MIQPYCPPVQATSRVRILLLALWAILTLVAVGYVLACGFNIPVIDEWEFVAVLVGKDPWFSWLWAQLNEHRMPLPRLIYLAQFRLTHDFRSGMLLVVAMMSGLSLWLMRFAAELRGRAYWTDAFFPISLLHIGQWENFLLGYQICFALFMVLASALVVMALRITRESAFRCGLLAGVLVLLLALTGGAGLVLVLPVAGWMVYLAALEWRTGAKRRALLLAVFALIPIGYLALCLATYQRPADLPAPSRDPDAIVEVAGQVLAMGLGVGVSGVWWAVAIAELALGIATIALLIRQMRDPGERPSVAGLIAIAAGLGGIAIAIGISRSDGLWSRYGSLSWPLLGAAYLAWVKAGRGAEARGLRKWIPVGLCLASALAFPPNMGTGMLIGASTVGRYTAMDTDLRAGIPDAELIRKYFPNSRDEGQEDRARWAIPMLREARIGLFAPDGRGEGALWLAGVIVLVVGAGGRWFWHLGRAVQVERARELFRLQHERFEEQLIKAARATGLPRGLRWLSCAITGDAVVARDSLTGGIVALVPVVIGFEAVEGSDMVDVPAAREPRPATAVFSFAQGTWETAGRVVFNHTPDQTVAKFAPQFRVLDHGHH